MKAKWLPIVLVTLWACSSDPTGPGGDNCAHCPPGTLCGDDGVCRAVCDGTADCPACHVCRDGLCYQETAFCLVSVVPVDGAVEIAPSQIVVLTFSEAVIPDSLDGRLSLSNADGDAVPHSVSAGGERIRLNPNSPLASEMAFRVRVDAGVTGLTGAVLEEAFESSFTTRPAGKRMGPQRMEVGALSGYAEGGGYELFVVGTQSPGETRNDDEGLQLFGGEHFWQTR